jgi:ABC-2 type transport system permease protein
VSWTIIRASLQQRRTSLLWYSIGLAFYSWFIVWYYPQFAGNEEFFEQLKSIFSNEMMAALGGADLNFGTLGGFLGVEYLSLIWVIIVGAAVMTVASKAIASEVEGGGMELTLSQPVSRLRVVLSRYVAMVAFSVILNIATVAPIWIACRVYDIEVDPGAMYLLFGLGLLLTLAIAGFAFMVSAFSTSGGRVAAVTSGVLGAMWLANFVAALNESTEFLGKLTVFHYWKPGGIIDDVTAQPESWWVFGVPALLFAAIAVWRFLGRDMAS